MSLRGGFATHWAMGTNQAPRVPDSVRIANNIRSGPCVQMKDRSVMIELTSCQRKCDGVRTRDRLGMACSKPNVLKL